MEGGELIFKWDIGQRKIKSIKIFDSDEFNHIHIHIYQQNNLLVVVMDMYSKLLD